MFSTLDLATFRFLNGFAGHTVTVNAIFIFGAKYLIYLMAALLVAYVAVAWKTTHFEGRVENVVCAFYAAVMGFILEQVIGFIWFRPRPFVALEHVAKLIDKSPLDKSFPSGHATLAFAMAFGIFLRNRHWGWPLIILAAFVGVSRVVVGVHYPTDILGGALLGYLVAHAAAPVKKALEPYLDLFDIFRKNKRPSGML
jgi:undecaprenyl-diphosphatase